MTLSPLVAAFLFAPVALGQPVVSISGTPDSGQRIITITSMSNGDSSSVRVVTRVPFQGIDYFIAIVPIDSSGSHRMPIYDPHHGAQRTPARLDSLRLIPADSILKLLPRREDFLRPRNSIRDH